MVCIGLMPWLLAMIAFVLERFCIWIGLVEGFSLEEEAMGLSVGFTYPYVNLLVVN